MKDRKEDIGEIFRKKLSDFDSAPSELKWEQIEKELDSAKKKPAPLFTTLLYTSITIGILILIYLFQSTTKDPIKTKHITNSRIYDVTKKTITSDSSYVLNKSDLQNIGITKTQNIQNSQVTEKDKQITNDSKDLKHIPVINKNQNSTQKTSFTSKTQKTKRTISGKAISTQSSLKTVNSFHKVQNTIFLNTKNGIDNSTIYYPKKDSIKLFNLANPTVGLLKKHFEKDSLFNKNKGYNNRFLINGAILPSYTLSNKFPFENDSISDIKNKGASAIGMSISFTSYLSNSFAIHGGFYRVELKYKASQNFDDGSSIHFDHKQIYHQYFFGASNRIYKKNLEIDLLATFGLQFLKVNKLIINHSNLGITNNSNKFIEKNNFNISSGLLIKYPISKRIYVTTSPMINYQARATKQREDTFTPLYFTLATGISIGF